MRNDTFDVLKESLQPLTRLPRCNLGEGPYWDVESQRLYWVDITGHRVHRWSPKTGACESHDTGTYVGFAIVDETGNLVAGLRDGIYAMGFGSAEKRPIAKPVMHPENRFNDGSCDPAGRLWAGTMHVSGNCARTSGALYRLTGGALETVERDIGISNGLGWSPDGATMYYAETHRGIVWAYAYDMATGSASDRRVFAEVPLEVGVPDGLTVDAAGRVFVAIWRGHRLNVYTSDGQLDDVIEMPVPHATSCCFGGSDLRTLFISTSPEGLSPEQMAAYPHSGLVFACETGVPGLPATRMRLA